MQSEKKVQISCIYLAMLFALLFVVTACEANDSSTLAGHMGEHRDEHGAVDAKEEQQEETEEMVDSEMMHDMDEHGDEVGHGSMTGLHNVPDEYARMTNPIPPSDDSIGRGAQLYQNSCAACHGTTGQGDGVNAAGLDPKPADLTDDHVQDNSDGALFYTISKGVEGTAMVPWEGQFSEEERWHLVNFVRTMRPSE